MWRLLGRNQAEEDEYKVRPLKRVQPCVLFCMPETVEESQAGCGAVPGVPRLLEVRDLQQEISHWNKEERSGQETSIEPIVSTVFG